MKFTIAMPVLNGDAFLRPAIESILAQTHTDWELVVVDGGSADASLEILQEYQKNEPRISVLTQQGTGMYDAIFQGLDHSQADVLCWLNCDDLYPNWALSTVARHFHHNAASDWVNGFPGVWDADGNLSYQLALALWPQRFIRKGYFHPELLGCIQAESTFFRKSLFDKLKPEERDSILQSKLAGDYLLWRRFAGHAKLDTIPTLLGGFRLHGTNRSITEISTYMDEVYSSGVVRIPRRLSILLGRLFRRLATVASYGKSHHTADSISREAIRIGHPK